MTINVTPIPKLTAFATPTITFGTAAPGTAATVIRSDSTIAGVGLITSVNDTVARYNGTGGQLQGYTSGGPVISDTGTITASAQPTVAVYADTQDNVTGNGTVYTVLWANEIWDIGGNFASNAFTAPIGGKYLICCQLGVGLAGGSANSLDMYIVSSNRNWRFYSDPNTTFTDVEQNRVIDMDASDTMTVTIAIGGSGSDNCDIAGGTSLRTALTIFKVG
jgi:hypothetical protein